NRKTNNHNRKSRIKFNYRRMKKITSILMLFVAFTLSAQIQNFNTKVRFKNVDVETDVPDYIYAEGADGVLVKVHKDYVAANGTPIWDFDLAKKILTVKDFSGIGNTGTGVFAVGNQAGNNNSGT